MTNGDTREALHAVAAMLGMTIVVTDDEAWKVGPEGLRVGLGWYARRGHSTREASALAALHLWQVPRERVRAPARARRRATLLRHTPKASPLIEAVSRMQAAHEMLAAFPGLREPLTAATNRGVSTDLTALPRHLQWAALVMQRGLKSTGVTPVVASEVSSEWYQLNLLGLSGDAEFDPLARVFAPNPEVTSLRRFERALALLLSPYLRLLAIDESERGLTVASASESEPVGEAPEQVNDGDFADALNETHSDEHAHDADRAREQTKAELQQNLFESEHREFSETLLATPMPARTAFASSTKLDQAMQQQAEVTRLDDRPTTQSAVAATALDIYRERATQFAAAIESVRALWARVIAERIALRPATSRRALPEGDDLATTALASIVAETLAGVERPNAFLRRIARPRRTRSLGSTDYVFLIDRSASMRGYVSATAADALLIMIEGLAAVERDIEHAEAVSGIDLELDIRTSLIVFGAEATVVKPLSHGVDDAFRRRMHAMIRTPAGSTNDSAALRAAAEQLGFGRNEVRSESVDSGGSRERKRLVILVSDGGSNDPAAAANELQRLREANVAVYAIGIGADDIEARYAPLGRRIDDPRALVAALEAIFEIELP